MQRFSGKVVVVTGAAQGIGRGVALRAAAEGGRVVFVDRAEFVAEVAAEAKGAETAGFVADLETYEGAKHGFAVIGHLVYDRDASERHWTKLVELLGVLRD